MTQNAIDRTRLFVAGAWRDAARGRTRPVLNPATDGVVGYVAHADLVDIQDAALAARDGFLVWRDTSAYDRSRIIRRAAQLLRERAPDIARSITVQQGKPIAEATAEVTAAADLFDWFSDEGQRLYGRIVPSREGPGTQQYVTKQPVGPVAAFTPWNFPLTQLARKIGPALSAGCSVVVKAPEETPAAPAAVVQAFSDAGLPAGVLNLLFGEPAEIASELIQHDVIRKVSFTGSTAVGKRLSEIAGRHVKRLTMELGGHAPVIVAEDADVAAAARMMAAAKFRNAGQICIAPSRFLVHESLKPAFAEAFVDQARAIVLGDGLEPHVTMGPLANRRRLQAMEALTADAVARGARLLLGGDRIGAVGNFWSPTVLLDVPCDARIFNEEPFGPIVALRGFTSLDDAVEEANRLPYGLAAYGFSRSMATIEALRRRLEVGMLWINTAARAPAEMPFGGVKESGYGSEGGPEALMEYVTARTATIKLV
jgi:succinate-semialdehyde dehydrogenase/glutarate-semialdehyde dehydrogenase